MKQEELDKNLAAQSALMYLSANTYNLSNGGSSNYSSPSSSPSKLFPLKPRAKKYSEVGGAAVYQHEEKRTSNTLFIHIPGHQPQ
jgi:hypothetical protein